MTNYFVTCFAADENPTYTARFHQDLTEAVARLVGRHIDTAMCRGEHGDTRPPPVADAGVFVALCSPAFYQDSGCGADWALFEYRLGQVPALWRPPVPKARVLVRWKPADPPLGMPRTPVVSGEVTDDYALIGLYGIARKGFRLDAYRCAVEEIAAVVCAGHEHSPPTVPTGEPLDLAPSFPASQACSPVGEQASVPGPRSPEEAQARPIVFLSYAHEKDGGQHQGRVKALHDWLAVKGVEVRLDLTAHQEGPQHWARWMRDQFKQANFVVVIVSPAYKRRAEHEESPGEGDGVGFEADYIIEERQRDRRWYRRILLVIFPEYSKEDLPDFLRGVTVYKLDPETEKGQLWDLLTYIKRTPPAIPNGPAQR
ncbi:TIR domain-containing protein [Streptomyces olivaceus]